MERQVKITSMVDGSIHLYDEDLRLSRIFERKGATKPVNFDILAEAIFNPGIEYFFKQGMLYIDNKQDRIDLGLEAIDIDENGKEEVLIAAPIALTDEQRKRYLTVMPLHEFKEKVTELPYEQLHALVSFAIETKDVKYEKAKMLKDLTGIDIMKAIELNDD